MEKDFAVVLASGGMDSCVTAAIAAQSYRLAFLHATYGQRTQERERRSFHQVADHYKVVTRLVVSLDHLSRIGGSSLTDVTIPVTSEGLHRGEIPSSYVPFRNANFLAAAVSWAEVLGAVAIFIGAVEEDASGYPDCRREFYDAFNAAIRSGTRPSTQITVLTPVIRFSKAEIVQRGIALGAPMHLTWSCYSREDVACGVCDSCARRLRGFQQAGIDDPIPYVERPQYLNVGV